MESSVASAPGTIEESKTRFKVKFYNIPLLQMFINVNLQNKNILDLIEKVRWSVHALWSCIVTIVEQQRGLVRSFSIVNGAT